MAYYYTRDHLGSIRELYDSSGNINTRYSYDPYGRTTLVSGTNLSDFQYAEYYAHQTSGLYLTKYRAYDPNTARWLSRDPAGEYGGLNLYGYVQNDPISFVDPLGLWINIPDKNSWNDYYTAMNYLSKDAGEKQIFDDLRTSPTKFTLVTNSNDDDHFDPKTNTIYWDPHSAFKPNGGSGCIDKGQSPALGLGHEFDHADAYDKGPTASNARHNTPDPNYDNAEEKRVISGSETTAAQTLGEGTRTDHGGTTYRVSGPTNY